MKQQIIPDQKGNYWFLHANYLVRYHPATQSCETYPLDKKAKLFAFVNEELVALIHGGRRLIFYNLKSRKIQTFGEGVPKEFFAFVRDLYVDEEGLLWVPTNDGLWKIDLEKEQSEIIGRDNNFIDPRFIGFYQDEEKRFWLGTYYGGIHIYDPKTKTVRIIDRRHGLSNNAVVSIIPDLYGDIWAATEYGINLLSPEGRVLTEFHEEDGLTGELFERFDPLRTKDGRLLFGNREGLNIIDPAAMKAQKKDTLEQKIYLTELDFYNTEESREEIRQKDFHSLKTLKLPAGQPFLKLKFALSSYIEPHRNRYAYKLEGLDEDWTFLGTQHELHFNRMPPGKYRLMIKGADYQNNWTAEPLVLSIHARDFFYKQGWFYALCVIFLGGLAALWIVRLRLEKSHLEREVDERTRQIRTDKDLIEQQAEELQRANQMQSRFFTNISHELRTPVTLIGTPIEQILEKDGASLSPGTIRSLGLVRNNTQKLNALVEEILELSKLEAGEAKLKHSPVALHQFIRQLFAAFESQAALKNIDYSFHSDVPPELYFSLDRGRLAKVVNNLLSNALKFTPDKGRVSLQLRISGRESPGDDSPCAISVSVQDTGRGIPAEDIPHIFDRYFQTKRSSLPTEGGTGIGLALSKELAQLMGGDLKVQSEWGAGSTFTLLIPDVDRAAGSLRPPGIASEVQPVADPSLPPETNSGRRRILVVEDNTDMQDLLHSLLEEHYECRFANNGAEAWELLQQEQEAEVIQLIVSDIMMPKMDGYTLLERIKATPHLQTIPIIMLTARTAEQDKLRALRMGVDDYLGKPFSGKELLVRSENLIRRYQMRRQYQLEEPEEETTPSPPSASQLWLQELEREILEAIDKQIDLNVIYLTLQMNISDRQLLRRLKSLTGLTTNQYIQEVKLQHARRLFEDQAFFTIAEVAYASGFNTPVYFSKVYENRFGKRPADYFEALG
jgi:signal transduction histidine kinase/DNA-binding response OmpR family regulator